MNYTKHIVILTPGFAKDEKDLNCIPSLQLFILGLKECIPTIRISIVAIGYPAETRNYKWNNIDVYSIGELNKIKKPFSWLKIFRLFKRIHKKNPVTLIHSFWLLEPTFIGYLLSKRFKTPLLATAQGQDTKSENKYLKLFKYLNIKITCCSQFNADELFKSSKIKTTKIIPFGINFHPVFFPNYNPTKEKTIDIIGIGSLVPVKNYKSFIEIIFELRKFFPEIKAMLIGGGIELNKLAQLIKEYKLEANLILTGSIESRIDVMNRLSESKIFLHTSLHEGQCYALMEAAAYQLDIVCYKVGFPPPSPRTHTCKSTEEMISVLEKIMKNETETLIPYPVMTMKQTIEEFKELGY